MCFQVVGGNRSAAMDNQFLLPVVTPQHRGGMAALRQGSRDRPLSRSSRRIQPEYMRIGTASLPLHNQGAVYEHGGGSRTVLYRVGSQWSLPNFLSFPVIGHYAEGIEINIHALSIGAGRG